jgi:hypothetical protein
MITPELSPDNDDDFEFNSETNTPSAGRVIERFNMLFGESRSLWGYGEIFSQLRRLSRTLVRTDAITPETLQGIFKQAHENLPVSATYMIAFAVLEEAATVDKLTGELLSIVEMCVMADQDPLAFTPEEQIRINRNVMRQLLANEYLFRLMVPLMSSSGDETALGDEE